jgi:hypothetical protein
MSEQGPPDAVMEFWDTFIEDVEATAQEYRESGWEVLELHPGDITPQPDPLHQSLTEADEPESEYSEPDEPAADDPAEDAAVDPSEERLGFDVLVPDDEFESLESVVDGAFEATSYETYHADRGEASFVLVVERDEQEETAIFVPIYHSPANAQLLQERSVEREVIHLYLRPLSRRRVVTFSHDEPELFFGEEPNATEQSG